jgi:hypothetical protein
MSSNTNAFGDISAETGGSFQNNDHDGGEEDMDVGTSIDDLPERLSDSAGLGNMPALTMLLEDDEVIDKFNDPNTAKYLREISMDPTKIDSLKETPEIKFMLKKVEKIKAELIKKGQDPGI